MIESAIANACGPDLATKIKLAINIGANEIFDHVYNFLKPNEKHSFIENYLQLICIFCS